MKCQESQNFLLDKRELDDFWELFCGKDTFESKLIKIKDTNVDISEAVGVKYYKVKNNKEF